MHRRRLGIEPDDVRAAAGSDAEVLTLSHSEVKETTMATDGPSRVVDDGSGTGSAARAPRHELVVAARGDEAELLALSLVSAWKTEGDRLGSRLRFGCVAEGEHQP